MAGGQASRYKLRLAQRRAYAVALRDAGGDGGDPLTYAEIAARIQEDMRDEETGEPLWPRYSQSQAWRDVKRAVDLARSTDPDDRHALPDESPELKERRDVALDLRLQGGSYRSIAETVRGYFVATALDDDCEPVLDDEGEPVMESMYPYYDGKAAWRDVKVRLDAYLADMMEAGDQVRALELMRLDQLLVPFLERALNGDYAAFDNVISLMGERRRYVNVEVEPPKQSLDVTSNGETIQGGTAQVVVYIPDNGRDGGGGDGARSADTDTDDHQAAAGSAGAISK